MTVVRSSSGSLFADKCGVVFLELLIAFVPMWSFFLCILQLALIGHADLIVKHSADSAARSAAVVLPDDPNEYGGEAKMSVARNAVTAADLGLALGQIGSAARVGASGAGLSHAFSSAPLVNIGRSRLNTIRLAAHVPLMPLAPEKVGHDSKPSIANAIGSQRRLVTALYYQPFALAVTFPGLQGSVANEPEITVRVTYAFQCTVPLARRILCRSFADLDAREEIGGAFFPMAQSIVGGRFRGLQHETTLLIHDAPYEYRPRRS